MNPGISRIIGLGGAALMIGDSVNKGLRKGTQSTNTEFANDNADLWMKHQTSAVDSNLLEKVKDWYRKFKLDDNYLLGFSAVKNKALSTIGAFAGNIVPLALSAGAIFITKPILRTACAAGLVITGASTFVREVMGIGKQ